ncbi:hypothetical protein [Streptomyces scabiei]|uniref:hypothetical protein n=1 Tax=Streptomyces scabiei TaxID=1930 RepID=UPI000ABF0EBF|nr:MULTISPECIES: hypothetical protein [Streptomyces]MDX2532693.1 hypothetical protein [Streptomyces scabiei]MDX2689863.1 hypothetical protein [Streptomyces scabiei]MDX2755006.1 hypothetical protein [Streptomyces scabiei]MDX2795251.1 hypothetical protein [Streptomyces scabiei]MDX2809077.1 hypothetical protein [Streptomyces scabiei]
MRTTRATGPSDPVDSTGTPRTTGTLRTTGTPATPHLRIARLLTVLAAVLAVLLAPGLTTPSVAQAANDRAAVQDRAGAAVTAAAAVWNPPSNLVQPLGEVWNHVESTYGNLYGFRNYGWDQVMANRGSVNYCVRWESDQPVSTALRDQIHAALKKQFGKWMAAMVDNGQGHNAWPYTTVPVNIVGWAVKNRSTLQWTDNSVDVYTNVLDGAGAPQCAPDCGRFFHQDGNYSRCPGGAARHYDQSLWLTEGFGGGAGGDWGQRMGRSYFTGALGQENIHIYLHEVGHTFGLDDFYDWSPTGQCCFLMKAGSATQITEFDTWMFRDFWRHLKSRYGL